MIRLVLWLTRRFRWVILASVARTLARWFTDNSVQAATQDIEERLPPAVTRALRAVPGDLPKVGGTAVVAHRGARRAASLSARLGRMGAAGSRRLAETRSQLRTEVDRSGRELRSMILADQGDRAGADDALLDRRDRFASLPADHDPFEDLPEPVEPGRPDPEWEPMVEVPRVQRSYRRPVKAWERVSRRQNQRGHRRSQR